MPPFFRIFALVACSIVTLSRMVEAADDDDALPPEPISGEWIEDTLDDDRRWFASSENLGFEAVDDALTGHRDGHRWVRALDGKPAWVMYYVPGDILGFEVDTHHYGARATEFRFVAGNDWNSLAPVEVDFEEIVAFEARWLGLYRAVGHLPPGARFLRIEFPSDAEVDAARLTEVWLRCRLDEVPPTPAATAATAAVAATPDSAISSELEVETMEPYVVREIVFEPPTIARPPRAIVAVDPIPPQFDPIMPETFGRWAQAALTIETVSRPLVLEGVAPKPNKPRRSMLATLWSRLGLGRPTSRPP